MSVNQQPEDREIRPDPNRRGLTLPEVEELLPAFVLGALDPEEMLAVDRFIQTHPALRTRLANYENAVAELAYAAPQAEPPLRAKAQLLSRVRRDLGERQPQAVGTTRSVGTLGTSARQSPSRLAPARQPDPEPEPTTGWWSIFIRTFAIAGATAAIAILAFSTFQLRNNMGRLTAQLQQVQSELTNLQNENNRLAQQNITLQEQLQSREAQYAILVNPEQSIALAATDAGPATGNFYARADQAILVLHGLQPLPADQTYQLWWLPPDGSAPRPGELLTITNGESASLAIAIPAEQRDFSGIGISIEPAGGRPTPTTVILLGKLAKSSA